MATATPQTDRTRSFEELEAMTQRVRQDILRMTYLAGSGHPGGSMSMTDILAVLYGRHLRVDPRKPLGPERDRFILSKGHCAPGLYAILAEMDFFPRKELWTFRKINAVLQGHADIKVPGVEMSSGSLGQGLSFGVGCALAARLDGRATRTYVMMGDGEQQEGQVWEAAMAGAHRKLDNLVGIVDYNKLQIDGNVNEVKNLEPLADKWTAFGWHVIEVDGHDLQQVDQALTDAATITGKPTLILAHTLKGKGVSFMENKAEFHGRCLKPDEMETALAELGADEVIL